MRPSADGPLLDRLLVVGTGLIGGSFAAAAKAEGVSRQVWGIDPQHAQASLALGHVDTAFPDLSDALNALCETASSASVAIAFATPVPVTARLLGLLAEHPRAPRWAFVTELGSTKRGIVEALQGLAMTASGSELLMQFVSSHPMAGSEQSGPQAARLDLYQGARVLISPAAQAQPEPIALLTAVWRLLGAQTVRLQLDVHDRLLAATSHFPHLIAYALAGALAAQPTAAAAQRLHGGGLRDTTRIAASSPALWTDILLDNRAEVLGLMTAFQAELDQLVQHLARADAEGLTAVLTPAAQWRRGFLHASTATPLDDELSE